MGGAGKTAQLGEVYMVNATKGDAAMPDKIQSLLKNLQAFRAAAGVFNPWRDYDADYDMDRNSPRIRAAQLEQYLRERSAGVRYILIAEAVGYQGGKFSGIALTSERMLLDQHQQVPGALIIKTGGLRTSNPNHPDLDRAQKMKGFAEPTATMVWGEIAARADGGGISPFEVVLWNIFPFHPYHGARGRLTNRTPGPAELEIGLEYARKLMALHPRAAVIAIGRSAARTLETHHIQHRHVTHPSNGGANKFREEIRNIWR